jgi:hypothetical protein
MVFRIVAGVVAGVVIGVVAGGDEVYQHHSSAWVVTGGHSSPMKGRGHVCSNEEQFAFPFNLQSNFVSRFSTSTVIQI